MPPLHPAEILLVEDNPGDVRLILEAVADAKLDNRLTTVRDGEKAMAFLRREGEFTNAVRPDLILLDLNLPRKDGREVLAEVKASPALEKIPVVILTSSVAEEDVLRAYNLNVNCYLTKPIDFEQLVKVIRSVPELSLVIVKREEARK